MTPVDHFSLFFEAGGYSGIYLGHSLPFVEDGMALTHFLFTFSSSGSQGDEI